MSCEHCFREWQIDRQFTRLNLQSPNEYITAQEEAIKIDLVPELPPPVGYEDIVTAMDVYSRYILAYPTSNRDAKKSAQVSNFIMTKHAYLPTALISDKGSGFTTHVIKEVAGVFGITIKRANNLYV